MAFGCILFSFPLGLQEIQIGIDNEGILGGLERGCFYGGLT